MRLNPIAAFRDYSKKKQLKAVLIDQLKKMPPGGSGVDIPMSGEAAPVWAAAVQELVKEYPNLTVVRFKNGLMLCRTADYQGTSEDLRKAMDGIQAIAKPGDALHED